MTGLLTRPLELKELRPRRQKRPELQLTKAVAILLALLDNLGQLQAIWYHVPNGGQRNAMQGAMLKAMGARAGIPDFAFAWATCSGFIELKSGKNGLSDAQKSIRDDRFRKGVFWAECRSVDEVKDTLTQWGIVRTKPPALASALDPRSGGHHTESL